MKLLVDRLTGTPARLDFEGDSGWWSERNAGRPEDGEGIVTEPFVFAIDAHQMGEDVYLEGEMSGAVELECSRCVSRYRHPLREIFRLVLEPARGRLPADPEGVEALAREGLWLSDDLELAWFEGSEVELGSYLAEVVSLAMPVQPLCAENCAGLCSICGRNRNDEVCSCGEAKPNSPFAALAALRNDG